MKTIEVAAAVIVNYFENTTEVLQQKEDMVSSKDNGNSPGEKLKSVKRHSRH